MEQRAQWSVPAWAAYYTLYSISRVQSSLSTGYIELSYFFSQISVVVTHCNLCNLSSQVSYPKVTVIVTKYPFKSDLPNPEVVVVIVVVVVVVVVVTVVVVVVVDAVVVVGVAVLQISPEYVPFSGCLWEHVHMTSAVGGGRGYPKIRREH